MTNLDCLKISSSCLFMTYIEISCSCGIMLWKGGGRGYLLMLAVMQYSYGIIFF